MFRQYTPILISCYITRDPQSCTHITDRNHDHVPPPPSRLYHVVYTSPIRHSPPPAPSSPAHEVTADTGVTAAAKIPTRLTESTNNN